MEAEASECYRAPFSPEMRSYETKPEQFLVEEFFDFSNDDDEEDDNVLELSHEKTAFNNNNVDTPITAGVKSTESSSATELGDFSTELCVPYDDHFDHFPELEWLSTLTEESFSSEEDMEKLQLISGYKARPGTSEFQLNSCKASHMLRTEVTVPAKARTKRPRPAPCNWSSPFLMASLNTSSSESQRAKRASKRNSGADYGSGSDGRKCLHCAAEKTPQWRTGPMGPKTLCNACGVRYKSGRLVPEYRPAASPTFVMTKHSNSHRKVIELRRQKEQQHFVHRQSTPVDGMNGEDYVIRQHVGPGFRQLI